MINFPGLNRNIQITDKIDETFGIFIVFFNVGSERYGR